MNRLEVSMARTTLARPSSRATLLSAALIAVPLSALADGHQTKEFSTEQHEALLSGNTVYLAVPPGGPGGPDGGIAPVKYGADGSAAAVLPAGMTLVGTWRLEDSHYCVDWDNGPKNSCTEIRRTEDGGLALFEIEEGQPRGSIERIVPGNPEGL